jgi:hypothetical protein
MNENEPDIDQQLQELSDRAGGLIESCEFAASSRLYGELRQRSRSEQRASFYIIGTFFQMDQAQQLLDFHRMRERAIELIALLEDPERPRQIQPDFPPEQHEHFVYTMSSCAYENLAEATGQLDGYNSEGMHACIADGIQICRRTGKMECIRCFREYACDVYLAADDPDIAAHQCRLVIEHEGTWSDRGNRRWFASIKQAWLHALQGRTSDALTVVEYAVQSTDEEGVSLKLESRMRSLIMQDTIRLAMGLEPVMHDDPMFEQRPSTEDCPLLGHMMELNRALQLTNNGQWDEANQLLTTWDRQLQKCGGTHLWFETRLRLIAMKRLSDQQKQAEALARQLEAAAAKANDWLTVRRLETLMAANQPSAIAPANMESAAAGMQSSQPSSQQACSSDNSADGAATEAADPEVSTYIEALQKQMEELASDPTEETVQEMRATLLAITPQQAAHHRDAAGVLHLMTFLVIGIVDGIKVWQWANAIAAPWQNKASVLSLLGTVGDRLRFSGAEDIEESITAERTEQLFRKSLQLETTRAGNYMRAGDHFRAEDNVGEAERCFARAFRLDRTSGIIVTRLADLYMESDRPRDALHVLDLSLREGCHEAQIAFEAAMTAFHLQQYDVVVTCLDRFVADGGESDWLNYYRAVSHYELGDAELGLQSLDLDAPDPESAGWHVEVMRGVVKARLKDLHGAAQHLQYAMSRPLYEQSYLSPHGIAALLMRIADVAISELQDPTLQRLVEDRLLRSGLMPDTILESFRTEGSEVSELHLCRCCVLQPLDDTWQSDPNRLNGQEDWGVYVTEWGILATSAEEAAEVALKWQARCGVLPATVEDVLMSEETFRDVPGVVWQAGRFPPADTEQPDSEFE